MERHEILADFLRKNYQMEIIRAAREEKSSVVVDFAKIDRFNPVLADELLEKPYEVLEDFEKAVLSFTSGEKIPVRIKNLPERRNIRLRNLRAENIGKLICTEVTIKMASEVKPQIISVTYRCPDCEFIQEIKQEDLFFVKKMTACQNCGRRGEFPEVEKKVGDFRILKGIEPFEITTGEQPSEIAIIFRDDLTTPRMQKKTDPGNRVKIVGMLKELPKRIKGKMITRLDTILEANYIEPSETDTEDLEISPEEEAKIHQLANDPKIYERLRRSLAPGLHGNESIKDAIVLQLFGGVPHTLPDGSRIRGNLHVLLTGDPGVGKTVLLKLTSRLVPRGRYVSGSGVTGAGLTATVRKDEVLGSWVLEAGALILCNKGLISIDEFDKMGRDDQIAMHEATSIETVSIAKASIVATLPAQTSVLAGANPKLGRFDPMRSVLDQINIPETLLSRFDLKFVMRDEPDRKEDRRIVEHITSARTDPRKAVPEIDVNILRKYIAIAKKIEHVDFDENALEVLKNFYVEMRSSSGEGRVGITLRQFEALIRLAEASAKIRLSTQVIIQDAERSIDIMKFSLHQLGYEEGVGYDIDKFESKISSSQRGMMGKILDIISDIEKEQAGDPKAFVKAAHEDEVKIRARDTYGYEEDKVDDVIDKLKQQGMIFSPAPGHVKRGG